ncbi:MAG: hypothetical protein ACRCZI_09370 [Cetobacterium sp.]
MRRNFENLKNEIEEMTRETNNFVTLEKGSGDARGYENGFYVRNIVTNSVQNQFKNLKEVEIYIEEVLK